MLCLVYGIFININTECRTILQGKIMITEMGVNFHFSEQDAGEVIEKNKNIKFKNDLIALNSKNYEYNN